MSHRVFAPFSTLAIVIVVTCLASPHADAQEQRRARESSKATPAATGSPAVARTPWGDPDLQGLWTNMIEARTPFERPPEFAARGITDPTDPKILQEERERDKDPNTRRKYERAVDEAGGRGTGAGPVHWYESLDPKRSRVWFVTDPPDGKVPTLTPEAKRKINEWAEARRGIGTDEPRPGGWVEDLSNRVRCVTRGIPEVYIPLAYNNNFQ